MRIPFFRQVAWYLIGAMFIIGIAPRVEAGLSPSEIINQKFDRAADIAKIQKTIETKMVRERLENLGYTPEDVNLRLGQLSDGQIHQLASNLDDVKIGRDDLGIVIALLVIAILIVIFIQLTGRRVVVQ